MKIKIIDLSKNIIDNKYLMLDYYFDQKMKGEAF